MNIKKNYSKKRHQSYASVQAHAVINGLIGVIVIAFISFYFFLTPLNPQSIAFWLTLIIALFVFCSSEITDYLQCSCRAYAGSGCRSKNLERCLRT